MEIEESSLPYRAFLRSGTYPALTQRVVRSGGVLARAAGWFALVVTAASAGYDITQRLAAPSAAEASAPARGSVLKSALASNLSREDPLRELEEQFQDVVEHEAIVNADLGWQRVSGPLLTVRSAGRAPIAAQRKRPGALAQPASFSSTPSPHVVEAASASMASQASAELNGARDPEVQRAVPIEELLRERAAAAPVVSAPVRDARTIAGTSATLGQAPRAVAVKGTPSLPLAASARVDGLAVRGPLSVAHVRRSVERVRPTLSDCYGEAARRAGFNRFSPVRVVVTIDEAGRVKTLPKVDGAQLPGFGSCLSSALSKLVCQAPDTGTARASIVLAFEPQR